MKPFVLLVGGRWIEYTDSVNSYLAIRDVIIHCTASLNLSLSNVAGLSCANICANASIMLSSCSIALSEYVFLNQNYPSPIETSSYFSLTEYGRWNAGPYTLYGPLSKKNVKNSWTLIIHQMRKYDAPPLP